MVFKLQIVDLTYLASILHCQATSLLFKYLGLPVGANMALARNWQPVIDKFQARLSIWKAKTLSFGERITLIKLVLNNLPIYYFSIFKAPSGVIDSLEKIRRMFLWGGNESNNKICWIN